MICEVLVLLFTLFVSFFKIGLFTFGGGYAMISNIRELVVEQKNWLDDDEMTQIIAVSESTPGPIAINMATYVGFREAGILGSIAATVGVVLPAFLIILLVSLVLDGIMDNRFVRYALDGIKCAVAFLILKAGVQMFGGIRKDVFSVVVFSAIISALLILDFLSLSFSSVSFIIAGGIAGFVFFLVSGGKEKNGK